MVATGDLTVCQIAAGRDTVAVTATDRPQRLVFGEVADDYERHRPHYPDELFDTLVERSGADAALDIGTGTGRSAVALSRRGLSGHAVEPDPDMAAVARAHLPDTWTVEVSDFERCDGGGRTDWPLATCAQAWHWIDDDAGFARAAELLAPAAPLALFWNRPDFVADALRAEMDEAYDRFAPDMQSSLRGRGTVPKGALELEAPPPGFASVERVQLSWSQRYSRDEWLGLLGTHSDHRLLDPDTRAALHTAVGDAIDRHGGSFTLPYRVELVLFTRS
jgi:SAM-dependent methyltransferase